jgi:pimeloyl-ACP methyl ester carboxylesterase
MSASRLARRALRSAALLYVLVVMLFAGLQRRMLFPAPPPAQVPGDAHARIDRRDARGTRFAAHFTPARGDRPTLVYLHGNGDQLATAVEVGDPFTADGFGFYAVEYPGYGPLRDLAPSEAALFASTDAALAHLRDALGVPAARTVLLGQSLGSCVATEMARRGHAARLALLSPFLSIPDVAALHFPWLPVRWIVRDRFDSAARAPDVTVPALVIHGAADALIPAAQGDALARRFPRGRYHSVPGAGHNDLWSGAFGVGVTEAVAAFARGAYENGTTR